MRTIFSEYFSPKSNGGLNFGTMNEIDCHGCGREFCLFICYLIINKYKERVSLISTIWSARMEIPTQMRKILTVRIHAKFFFSPFWKQPVYSWRRPRDGIKTGLSGS